MPSSFLLLLSLATLSQPAVVPAAPEFLVVGQVTPALAAYMEQRCDGLRQRLSKQWLHKDCAAVWNPPCEIHMHSTRASYARAVGGGNQTFASSATRSAGGRITLRRIDLCCERLERAVAALPHETLHLLLADEFADAPPPRWLDEGLALLADSEEKRAGHQQDLALALRLGTRFSVERLMQLEDYPPSTRTAAFYAQSTSLVSYLLTRGSMPDLLRMAHRANEIGHERALLEVYGLDSPSLEAAWLRYAVAPH